MRNPVCIVGKRKRGDHLNRCAVIEVRTEAPVQKLLLRNSLESGVVREEVVNELYLSAPIHNHTHRHGAGKGAFGQVRPMGLEC